MSFYRTGRQQRKGELEGEYNCMPNRNAEVFVHSGGKRALGYWSFTELWLLILPYYILKDVSLLARELGTPAFVVLLLWKLCSEFPATGLGISFANPKKMFNVY